LLRQVVYKNCRDPLAGTFGWLGCGSWSTRPGLCCAMRTFPL
jgi:hypothetical protein